LPRTRSIPAVALAIVVSTAAVFALVEPQRFGAPISAEAAVPVATVLAEATAHAGKIVKVSGRTDGVCTRKGCWLTLEGPKKTSLRVTFRDYGFFVPKEILGRDVVVEGTLEIKEQSVAELRHLAEDAGRSADEVAAIVAPETTAVLVADGVLVVETTQP
jgi:Domain of unknown function (DUF4920)